MSVEITGVSISPTRFAVGETPTLKFTVKNTGSYAITHVLPMLYVDAADIDGSDDGYTQNLRSTAVSIAKNASREITVAAGPVEEGFLAFFSRLGVRAAPARMAISASDTNSYAWMALAATPGVLLDRRYSPRITSLTARRAPTEESTAAAVGIDCALADGADATYPGLSLTLQWKEVSEADFPAGNRLSIDIAQALSQGGALVSPEFVFSIGAAYALRATFTDGYETAFAETVLPKAFANLHLSGTGAGVAVGQYSTSTEENPKFESAYPIIGYGGLYGQWAISVGFASDGTFAGGAGSNVVIPFDAVIGQVGQRLTLDTGAHGVIVGAGIAFVEVSVTAGFYQGLTAGATRRVSVAVNGATKKEIVLAIPSSTNLYTNATLPPLIVPVAEGDVIIGRCRSDTGSAGTMGKAFTYMTVRALG